MAARALGSLPPQHDHLALGQAGSNRWRSAADAPARGAVVLAAGPRCSGGAATGAAAAAGAAGAAGRRSGPAVFGLRGAGLSAAAAGVVSRLRRAAPGSARRPLPVVESGPPGVSVLDARGAVSLGAGAVLGGAGLAVGAATAGRLGVATRLGVCAGAVAQRLGLGLPRQLELRPTPLHRRRTDRGAGRRWAVRNPTQLRAACDRLAADAPAVFGCGLGGAADAVEWPADGAGAESAHQKHQLAGGSGLGVGGLGAGSGVARPSAGHRRLSVCAAGRLAVRAVVPHARPQLRGSNR